MLLLHRARAAFSTKVILETSSELSSSIARSRLEPLSFRSNKTIDHTQDDYKKYLELELYTSFVRISRQCQYTSSEYFEFLVMSISGGAEERR